RSPHERSHNTVHPTDIPPPPPHSNTHATTNSTPHPAPTPQHPSPSSQHPAPSTQHLFDEPDGERLPLGLRFLRRARRARILRDAVVDAARTAAATATAGRLRSCDCATPGGRATRAQQPLAARRSHAGISRTREPDGGRRANAIRSRERP